MIKNFARLIGIYFLFLPLISCASKASEAETLNPTIYYKPTVNLDVSKCTDDDLRDVVTEDGKVLTTMCSNDYKSCLMQGSCFVHKQGKVRSFNYQSLKDGVYRFVEVDIRQCPYGYGVRNSCLDPYFTVAADLQFYKPGDVIFVPRLVGAKMPNGEIHDGFLIVRDRGGGIIGANRFDFFTGFYSHLSRENTMARLGFGDKDNKFEFRKATDEEAAYTRSQRGYPRLRPQIQRMQLQELGFLSDE
jgi:hypothetical protein